MSTQTKIGLLLCLLLVCAFGYVVYSKTNEQDENADGQRPQYTARPQSNDESDGAQNDGPEDPFAQEAEDRHGNAYRAEQQRLPRDQLDASQQEQRLRQVAAGQREPSPWSQSPERQDGPSQTGADQQDPEQLQSASGGNAAYRQASQSGEAAAFDPVTGDFSPFEQSRSQGDASQYDRSAQQKQQSALQQEDPSGPFAPQSTPEQNPQQSAAGQVSPFEIDDGGTGGSSRRQQSARSADPQEEGDPPDGTEFIQRTTTSGDGGGTFQQAATDASGDGATDGTLTTLEPGSDNPDQPRSGRLRDWDNQTAQTDGESDHGEPVHPLRSEPDWEPGISRQSAGSRTRQHSYSQSSQTGEFSNYDQTPVDADRQMPKGATFNDDWPSDEPSTGSTDWDTSPHTRDSDPYSENAPENYSDRPAVHVVDKGDSFWSISKDEYGAGRYCQALARYNRARIPDPNEMRPGMKVLIPDKSVLVQRYPDLFPGRAAAEDSEKPAGFFLAADGTPRYRVGRRDTLTGIAQKHLGRASRWVQILALNRDRIADARRLKPGTELRLPADASAVGMVRQPHDFR